MSKEKKESNSFSEFETTVAEALNEASVFFEKGNGEAGKRARLALSKLTKLSKALREEIQEAKNAKKAEKAKAKK